VAIGVKHNLLPPSGLYRLFSVSDIYLRQGGYVFVAVCLFVCLSVSNFAHKLPNGLHEIFREGWQWANEQTLNFGGDPDPDPYRDTGKTGLGEGICTVPLLIVYFIFLRDGQLSVALR